MRDERSTGLSWSLISHPSQRRFAALTGADAHRVVDVREEDLAVADLAGATGLHNRADDRIHLMIRDHHLQLHLWEEADLVFHAAIPLDVAALAAAAPHLARRHPHDPEVAEQRV